VAEDSVERRHYKQEAERLLDSVIAKNAIERKAISLKMELAVGKVTDVIQSMVGLASVTFKLTLTDSSCRFTFTNQLLS